METHYVDNQVPQKGKSIQVNIHYSALKESVLLCCFVLFSV